MTQTVTSATPAQNMPAQEFKTEAGKRGPPGVVASLATGGSSGAVLGREPDDLRPVGSFMLVASLDC